MFARLVLVGDPVATAPHIDQPLRFGSFELDLVTGELSQRGRPVRLRPQAAKILTILASQPGHLVTRDQLREKIWGLETFVDFEHGLNLCIRQIRAALHDEADSPRYVETLPKRGYRFIGPVERTDDKSEEARRPAPRRSTLLDQLLRKRARLVSAAFVLAVLLAGGYWSWRRAVRVTHPPNLVMLAVLPLENLSGNPDQEYFSDGLTEEMITRLGRLNPNRLGVIARTSTNQYKRTRKPVDQIGRELHVDYVLEGSVRRDAERVRVSVQLIRVSDQTHLWAENYQRNIRDVLALQSDVAGAIAREISIKLTPEEEMRWARLRPTDPEAHQAYLKGLFYWNKRTRSGLEKAVEHFEEAVARDPEYALAYVGLANSYALLPVYGDFRPHEYYPRARVAALKALQIDDRLGEAHAVLGVVKREYEWDHAGAEREYQNAIELSPGYATAHQWYAEYLALMGRRSEAWAEIQRALEIDPLSPIVNAIAGWVLFYARQYDESVAQLKKTTAMHPDFIPAHGYLAWAFQQKGMVEEAKLQHRRVAELSGGKPPLHLWQSEANLKQLEEDDGVPMYYLASAYANVGDHERALQWLEKCIQQRDLSLLALKVDPWMDPLRSDPRFHEMLRRVGLHP